MRNFGTIDMQEQKREREHALHGAVSMGREAAQILNAPIVQDWFSQTEQNLIEQLLNAPAGEQGHSIREGLCAQLRANRQLARSLDNAVKAGERASNTLEQGAQVEDGRY